MDSVYLRHLSYAGGVLTYQICHYGRKSQFVLFDKTKVFCVQSHIWRSAHLIEENVYKTSASIAVIVSRPPDLSNETDLEAYRAFVHKVEIAVADNAMPDRTIDAVEGYLAFYRSIGKTLDFGGLFGFGER